MLEDESLIIHLARAALLLRQRAHDPRTSRELGRRLANYATAIQALQEAIEREGQ